MTLSPLHLVANWSVFTISVNDSSLGCRRLTGATCCTQRWTPSVINWCWSSVELNWLHLWWSACSSEIPENPECVTTFQREVSSYLNIPGGTVAAWRSGNGVGRINEVTLRRARLVLGWVTVSGFDSRRRQFILVCKQPPRSTQPSTLRGTVNECHPKGGDALRLGSKGRHGVICR